MSDKKHILFLPKGSYKTFKLHTNGSLTILLDTSDGWGTLAGIFLDMLCSLTDRFNLHSKIRDLFFSYDPDYKIVSKRCKLYTPDAILQSYLELQDKQPIGIKISAVQLIQTLDIDIEAEIQKD